MMANEVGNATTNGYSHNNPYATNEQNFGSHQVNNGSSAGYANTPSANTTQSGSGDISKEEVAWYFVEQYYTTMSRNPEKLYVRSLVSQRISHANPSLAILQQAVATRLRHRGRQARCVLGPESTLACNR